ncbi:MAG: hypothetical protein H6728_15755 [Myxococcales bacterium]|nr:hypothetical protein [Myxococcales bacterium]
MLLRHDPSASWLRRLMETIFLRITTLTYSLTFPIYEVAYLLWRCPEMLPPLWRIWSFSWGRNPYTAKARMPKTLREGRHPNDLVYGEVTIPAAYRVLQALRLGPNDLLIDLGCGRGHLVMLAAARGIPAHGIELVPLHLRCAKHAAAYLPLATFEQADILEADLSKATVFWATGTCWSEELRRKTAQRIVDCGLGLRVVSLSSPLPHPQLQTVQVLYGWTTWGRDAFFIQQVQETSTPQEV